MHTKYSFSNFFFTLSILFTLLFFTDVNHAQAACVFTPGPSYTAGIDNVLCSGIIATSSPLTFPSAGGTSGGADVVQLDASAIVNSSISFGTADVFSTSTLNIDSGGVLHGKNLSSGSLFSGKNTIVNNSGLILYEPTAIPLGEDAIGLFSSNPAVEFTLNNLATGELRSTTTNQQYIEGGNTQQRLVLNNYGLVNLDTPMTSRFIRFPALRPLTSTPHRAYNASGGLIRSTAGGIVFGFASNSELINDGQITTQSGIPLYFIL
jgi:hypothetical protein